MRIDDFTLEYWLNPACDSEKNKYYLGGSCVLPMTVEELFDLTGESMESFFEELKHMNLAIPASRARPARAKRSPGSTKTSPPMRSSSVTAAPARTRPSATRSLRARTT